MVVDSNHRSVKQQIYSLSPLATRETIQRADDRTRTDNLLITNQLLCQLSHIGETDDIRLATRGGLEPPTSAVTGRRSNQLNHRAIELTHLQNFIQMILITNA